MDLSLLQEEMTWKLKYTMNKQENLQLVLKEEGLESQVILIESSVPNLIRIIRILLYQGVGITMWRFGILDSLVLSDLCMGHIYVEMH